MNLKLEYFIINQSPTCFNLLKDKISIDDISDDFYDSFDNTIRDEALSALSSLGISKNIVDKHINDILKRNENISLEELIKEVLKRS